MNEKECYNTISEFLDQIEKQYGLEKGSYRITFYARQDVMVCFSVIAADKSRIRIDNNVLISFSEELQTTVNYRFRYRDFMFSYLNKNLKEFDQLSNADRTLFVMETLNEVYIDQAVIPTQLL